MSSIPSLGDHILAPPASQCHLQALIPSWPLLCSLPISGGLSPRIRLLPSKLSIPMWTPFCPTCSTLIHPLTPCILMVSHPNVLAVSSNLCLQPLEPSNHSNVAAYIFISSSFAMLSAHPEPFLSASLRLCQLSKPISGLGSKVLWPPVSKLYPLCSILIPTFCPHFALCLTLTTTSELCIHLTINIASTCKTIGLRQRLLNYSLQPHLSSILSQANPKRAKPLFHGPRLFCTTLTSMTYPTNKPACFSTTYARRLSTEVSFIHADQKPASKASLESVGTAALDFGIGLTSVNLLDLTPGSVVTVFSSAQHQSLVRSHHISTLSKPRDTIYSLVGSTLSYWPPANATTTFPYCFAFPPTMPLQRTLSAWWNPKWQPACPQFSSMSPPIPPKPNRISPPCGLCFMQPHSATSLI